MVFLVLGALTLRLPIQEQEGHQLVQKLASRPVGLPRGTTKHKKWQVGLLLPAPGSSARHPLTIFSRRLPPFAPLSPPGAPLSPSPPSHRAFSAEERPGTQARLRLRTSVIPFLGFFAQFSSFCTHCVLSPLSPQPAFSSLAVRLSVCGCVPCVVCALPCQLQLMWSCSRRSDAHGLFLFHHRFTLCFQQQLHQIFNFYRTQLIPISRCQKFTIFSTKYSICLSINYLIFLSASYVPSAPAVKGGCQLQDVPALIVSLLRLPNDAFFACAEVFLAF